ncbi:MAG: hypothetical protein IFK94_05255 [Acidobacteria bacterium]|uniref:Uncharacterized protein n=1 Tax=Candidatus Polarisedimenticola svalbardensis TaxID=2886004 RepID=A0A8J7CCJ5_9BACT|nr:hypothetical protein [Candidatus Polarisedimenticola svalbardensis]
MIAETDLQEQVKQLALSYIRGELTAGEVRVRTREDAGLSELAAGCIGVCTFPHELLEQAEVDPFVSEVEFDPPLAITREGMVRNLDLAKAGELPPLAFSDWVTDWFSWQIAARPDDEVILELAGELMLGEEAVEEILNDPFRMDLVRWHLANTPAALGGITSFGLTVAAHRQELADLARSSSPGEDPDDDGPTRDLQRLFKDCLDAMPGLADDLAEAMRILGEAGASDETIHRFMEKLARTADPLAAVEADF